MIGQKNAVKQLNLMKRVQCFCLVGSKGQGKKTLAEYIAKEWGLQYVQCDTSVEAVREILSSSIPNVLYCFPDADEMSINAQNALLKSLEEPKTDVYYILTVPSGNSLQDTLMSRLCIITMEQYSSSDIKEYAIKKYGKYDASTANNLWEYDVLQSYGKPFSDYIKLVLENIALVDSANAFKSGEKLALHGEEDKYNLTIFFNAIIDECYNNMLVDVDYFSHGVLVTAKYCNQSRKKGANLQMLYDNWVFEIRSWWCV